MKMKFLQPVGTEQNFSYVIMKTPLIHNTFLILIFTFIPAQKSQVIHHYISIPS